MTVWVASFRRDRKLSQSLGALSVKVIPKLPSTRPPNFICLAPDMTSVQSDTALECKIRTGHLLEQEYSSSN